MAQYNTLNVKFGKLKSGIINSTEETLNFSDFVKLLQMVYQLILNFEKLTIKYDAVRRISWTCKQSYETSGSNLSVCSKS